MAGEKRTALLEARWAQAWKEAQAKGATAADQSRLHNLFMAGVIEDQYRRAGEDFVLYSIGWNEKDDSGVIALLKDSKLPRQDSKEGDWVWSSATE